MITVANRLYIAPEHAQAFEQRFLARPKMVNERPGFIKTHLLRPTQAGEPYVVLTFWQDRQSFESWRSSPGFKEGHKGGHSLPAGTQTQPNVFEIHEVFG